MANAKEFTFMGRMAVTPFAAEAFKQPVRSATHSHPFTPSIQTGI